MTVLEYTYKSREVSRKRAETIEKTSKMLKTWFFFGYDFIIMRRIPNKIENTTF